MSNEAGKTKLLCPGDILPFLKGNGIDIGCGPDPILPTVDKFDKEDGDANDITKYVSKKYDFVFSSHALEHMHDPFRAAQEWFKLLNPGGFLVTLVPDEDLYEQGIFPSAFNPDHKVTFSLSKSRSWSPRSINVIDLAKSLEGELVTLRLQDAGYDRSLLSFGGGAYSRLMGKVAYKINHFVPGLERPNSRLMRCLGAVIDQTNFHQPVLAQICFVVKKRGGQ